MDNTLDPTIVALTRAIKKNETGTGDTYNLPPGKDGEKGAYQFLPSTWSTWAGEHLGDSNAPMTMDNQNKVAYAQVKKYKDAGYNPGQIASLWNSGKPDPTGNVGTSKGGAKYDTPAYVNNVYKDYETFKGSTTPTTDTPTPDTTTPTPEQPIDNSVIGKIGNVTDKVTGLFGMNPLLKGIGQTISNTMGTQDEAIKANQDSIDIQTKLLDTIKAKKAKGEDTTRLDSALKDITAHIKETSGQLEDIGTQGITNKEVIGSAISTAATAIPGVGKGASLLTKVLAGAGTGYAFDVGSNLQNKNKTLGQDFTPGLGSVVGAALPFAGLLISSLTKKIVGFTAGTGEQVIQNAIDNPDVVGDAMKKFAKNPEAKQELIDKASNALQDFSRSKGKEFGNAIDNMAVKEGATISKQPAIDALKSSFDDFGIKEIEGKLDFSNSSLSKESESAVKQIFDKVNNWVDETPKGLDSLRQYLRGEMGNYKIQGASKVDAIINDAMKALRTHLSENVEGYSNTLQTFSEKSQLISNLSKELGVSGTAKTSTKLSNILKIFKKDPSVMDYLYKVMGDKESKQLLNEISGAILSDWIPAGKVGAAMRTAGEIGLGIGAHALGAGAIPAVGAVATGAALASPRVVGGIATAAGSRIANVGSQLLKKGISQEVSKSNP